MKKYLYLLIVFIFGTSCHSVRKYNEQINKPHTVKQLRSDVDFVSRKLEKLHPDLYWYISKSELERKFDSLKSSIEVPMTSNELFLQLSPVVASVRQGHIQIFPLSKKYNSKQNQSINKYAGNALAKFDFELFNDKLYVAKNYSSYQQIKPGSELVSVNTFDPKNIIEKYAKTTATDGFNQTFIPQVKIKRFPRYHFIDNGLADSISCVFNYNDTLSTFCLKRIPEKKVAPQKEKIKPNKADRLERKKNAKIKAIRGYDPIKGLYSRTLYFPEADSTIAVMKISSFKSGNHSKFYKQSFDTLKKAKTETLILDLRNNTGGKLSDVASLYSYLTDSDYVFINPAHVNLRTSLWHTNYFRGTPIGAKPLLLLIFPIRLGNMISDYIKTKKDSAGNFYISLKESKPMKSNPNNFKGKVYVLINGSSFSATSIISANLKASSRATFVGEETGGAFNGTVAGRMPFYYLPNSKLKFSFGLMTLSTPNRIEPDGYGIRPDIYVKPTLTDILELNDPELSRVLQEIKNKK